jgi:hypothetical protein
MSAVQEQQILKTLHSFCYSGVWDFALKQAQILVSEKIAYYQSRIDYYEAKYGMNYATFCAQFHQIAHPTLLEREDDSIEWDAAIAAVRAFTKDRRELFSLCRESLMNFSVLSLPSSLPLFFIPHNPSIYAQFTPS